MTPAAGPWLTDRRYIQATWTIIAVAAVLRFWDLGGPSLWFDEIVYVINARGSFADVFFMTQTNNSSPLLLPLLMNILERTAGLNEFTARLPSAVFGVAAVFVLTRLSDVGVGRVAALTSAALLAAAQMQIMYSQEVREYGLSVLVSAVLLWSFLRVLSNGDYRPLLAALVITPWASYGPCFAALAVLTSLVFLRVMKRTPAPYTMTGLSAAAFFASAAASYFAVAQYQLGTAQQWYLIEHYFKASGMGLPEWLVTNAGGIVLASVPGLLAVIVLPVITVIYLAKYVSKPLALLDEPGIIATAVLIGGMVLAGLLELYPFGSPRHSVFIGPFLCLTFAIGLSGFIASLPPARQRAAAAGLGGLITVSALLAIFAVPLGAGLHPALAKVARIEVYGEYQDNRALMNFARIHRDKTLYGTFGAGPAHDYYGPELGFIKADISLMSDPEGVAAEILTHLSKGPVAVVMSNIMDGESEAIRSALRQNGAVVTDPFAAKRVEGFVVSPAPGAP